MRINRLNDYCGASTQVIRRQNNCLNLFRLIAAIQVAYGHIIIHMMCTPPNFVSNILGYFQGVPIFFILSGFLIWDSIDRSKSYNQYLKKRFWRIYPELWIAVLIEIIAILYLYNVTNVKQLLLFIFTQATFFQFWTPDFLRGYGCGTPNGSLWTIGVIIQFYIIIWFIRKILHNRGKSIWVISFIIAIILGMIPVIFSGRISNILIKLYQQSIFNYSYLFLIGSFIAEYRDKIIGYIIKFWWLFTLVAVALYITNIDIPYLQYAILKNTFSVIGIIGFAYSFPKLNIKTDISYGLYIYHMTIVNVMITLGFIGEIKYILIALLLSVLFAYISTKTIGLMSYKKKAILK